MALELISLSKLFGTKEVIPEWDVKWESNSRIGIFGNNGSGKSTFLKLLSGQLSPSSGKIIISGIPEENLSQKSSYCGPDLDLFKKFTIKEHFEYHNSLKPLRSGNSIHEIGIASNDLNKPLGSFSSGMKQRVKLALSIFSNSPLLLLDEPTSHLDTEGIKWYQECLSSNLSPSTEFNDRILIVASNHKQEETYNCTSYYLPSGKTFVP